MIERIAAGVVGGLLRYIDEEWGDRFSRWRIHRLKKKIRKMKQAIDDHARTCKIAGVAEFVDEPDSKA